MNKKEKPIGIFDSGIGGLTVLKEIFRELPFENTVYLGDTARVPYGIRSPETVTRYSFENAGFLISEDIKLLVIACNTASSVSLAAIRSSVPVPVVGVIRPGARAAVSCSKNKKIGVIGTEATIKSYSYTRAIKEVDGDVEVFSLACPLFVPLVEEGWSEGRIAEMIAETYLNNIRDKCVDTLVLGCTHYPLLKNVITKVMSEKVTLIDSAVETAGEVKNVLNELSLRRTGPEDAIHKFYVTDSTERFVNVGEKFLGRKIDFIKKIEMEMEV
ncbi:MAG: glutamate racemase [Nitrospirota bacterium]|nr:glutamate racemase [Nitrospirota bacterium]